MAIQSNFPAIRPSLLLDFANSKRLDPRITFTRASTARYYDGSTVAKAEENLFTQSQGFNETAWGKTNSTVTANTTTAPDGTSTADTFTPNAATAFFRVNQTSTFAGPITVSAFVKANGYSKVAIREDNATGSAATFDLSTGAVIGVVNAGAVTVSNNTITALADSWYRISCTFTGTGSLGGAFLILDPGYTSGSVTATWAANGTDGIFIWGAQLEQRSAVTAYTATTTAQITNYVPVLQTAQNNVPRFDHNPTTGESLGLLIEEQRTNLFLYSGDLSDAAFVKSSVTVSSNTIVAPDGTLTGDKVIVDSGTASASGVIRQQITKAASAITYTASFFAKAGEFNSVRVIFRDVSNSANFVQTYFNLATGTVASAANSGGTFSAPSSSISAVGNGWYRCVLTGTTGTETTVDLRVLEYNNGTNSITGDGYSGLYLWGYQLEAGAFATSYIATTAATATRSADAASMTGTNFSSWYDAAEGTMYYDGAVQIIPSASAAFFSISDNTTSNFIAYAVGSTTDIRPNLSVTTAGTSQANLTNSPGVAGGVYFRAASAYKVNDFAACRGGGTVSTDTSGVIPVVDRLYVGSATGTVRSQVIKKFAYYPLRLTDAQLQAITG